MPDFEVPAPPTFDEAPPVPAMPDVPPAPDLPEIFGAPSAPSTRAAARSAGAANDLPATSGDPGAPVEPARVPTRVDTTSYPEPGDVAVGSSYRGWTVAIFLGLLALLAAAVGLLVFLSVKAPLSLPWSDERPIVESAAPQDSGDAVVATAGCDEFCGTVAEKVGGTVTGDDGVEWTLRDSWQSADAAGAAPAGAMTVGNFVSTHGELALTAWRFDDDAAAADGFALIAETMGEPVDVGTVYSDGRGIRNDFSSDSTASILWTIPDESRPWVVRAAGPDVDETVFQFYVMLPI